MEDIILRFPTVAESIFAELDNGSLTNSKMVTNLWATFITAGKIPWIRRILKYSGNMVEFFTHWKKTLKRAPAEIVQELALNLEEFYGANQGNLLMGINNKTGRRWVILFSFTHGLFISNTPFTRKQNSSKIADFYFVFQKNLYMAIIICKR